MGMEPKVVIEAVHMLSVTRANMSTPMSDTMPNSVLASTSILMPAHTSVYDTDTGTSKIITSTIAKSTDISVKILIQKSIIPPVNGTIFHQVKPAIIKSLNSVSAEISATIPFHSPVSESITVREFGNVLHMIIYISMVIIIVC